MKKHLKFLFVVLLLIPMMEIRAQVINVSTNSLSGFSYMGQGPSEEDTLVVSGSDLNDQISIGSNESITITMTDGSRSFEISTVSGEDFSQTIVLHADNHGNVEPTTIYVRMVEGLSPGTYTGEIELSSKNAETVTVQCNGQVMEIPTVSNPIFDLPSGTYTDPREVNITCDTVEALIKYRTSPSELWQDFTSPILVDRDMTIWAKAVKDGYNDSEEVSASYAIEYTIEVTADPEQGEVFGGGIYHYDDIAVLTAIPNTGYIFSSWSNGETANPMEFPVTGHASYEAIFEVITYHVTVMADPEYGGDVDGGGTYSFFSNCTVTATANEGFAFINWTVDDEVVSTESVYTFHSWTDRTLVAHFMLLEWPNIIGEITAPVPICQGNSLQLTPPEVSNAEEEAWQLSSNATFDMVSVYTDQILDETYNGWYLRYMATNSAGTTYSDNIVTITVYPSINETDVDFIEGKKCGYSIEHLLIYPHSGLQYQWYKDGEAIHGATEQFYYSNQGMESGHYWVEISEERDENGNLLCPIATPEYEVKSSASPSFTMVHPNPSHVNESLFIQKEDAGEALLSIYSVDGRLLHRQALTQGQNVINFSLPSGVYVANIVDAQGEMRMEKIIVQ